MATPESRIAELGIQLLPTAIRPVGRYRLLRFCNGLGFTSGHGPRNPDGTIITGRVGHSMSLSEAKGAARMAGIALLTTLKSELGSLNRVSSIVKATCFVQSDSDFMGHPEVANGLSELLIEVFGTNGEHARAAVGVASLPNGIPVECELVIHVSDRTSDSGRQE